MRRNDLADLICGSGSRIDRCFHRTNIALHDDRNQPASRLLLGDELDVGRLDHRIGRLDRGRQSFRLDESECLQYRSLFLLRASKQEAEFVAPPY